MTSENATPVHRASIVSNVSLNKSEFELLSRWFEICTSYNRLHYLSCQYYKRMNHCFMIPIISISTCTGALNLMMSFVDTMKDMQIALGVLGLITGVLTSIYNFMEIAQLQEKHDMYANQFEKHARSIEMEMVLNSNTYISIGEYIKILKADLDRLIDNGPIIPMNILKNKKRMVRTIEDVEMTEHSLFSKINVYESEKNKNRNSLDELDLTASTLQARVLTKNQLKKMIMKDHENDELDVAL